MLIAQKGLIEPKIRLSALIIRGQVDAVKLVIKAKVPQLISGEASLGIAQQPQAEAFAAQGFQGFKYAVLYADIIR